MTNTTDSLRLLIPIVLSPLKKEWPGQNTDDPNEGKPLHRYFGVYGELPFGSAPAGEKSIWTDIITYSQRQNDPKKAIKELPEKSGLHPWQLCGAMPVYVDDSPKIAAKIITKLFYGQNSSHNIPSLTQGEFLAKATQHFEAIKYIDVELGTKRFPRTLGQLVKICRQRLGITQRELGDIVGHDKSSITGIESDVQGIALETIDNFAQAFGLTGKGREIFYKLSGHRSPEACIKAMKEAKELKHFVIAAREKLRLTQEKLAAFPILEYADSSSISLIEKGAGIPLTKVEKFIKALQLEGEDADTFYRLSGHRSPEACTEAMMECGTLEEFACIARERQRLTQSELTAILKYAHYNSIHNIEKSNKGIPPARTDDFSSAYKLEEKEKRKFLHLVHERQEQRIKPGPPKKSKMSYPIAPTL